MGQTPPDTSAERYRRRAAELREMAEATKDAELRREIALIARQYDKLADDVSKKPGPDR
jgi:hypothetical protein